jgi:hypothetical protein
MAPVQNSGAHRAMSGRLAAAPNAQLPVDAQIAALRIRVEELALQVAGLRAQLAGECVRQTANGNLIFPANAQRVQASLFGNSITLDAAGCRIEASGQMTLNASAITANAGQVQTNAGMANFSGVVKCDTIIANSVVGSSYTPGAGNIW